MMTRMLLLTLLAISLVFCSGFGRRPSLVERVLRSVVAVTFTTDDGNPRLCTGFVVNTRRGEVLTARHCLNPDGEVRVDDKPSQVLKKDDAFALLSIHPMSRPSMDIRTKPLLIGERVFTFGFGYGMLEVFGRGIAVKHEGDIGMDGPILPGMSGGPVVDMEGKVVGINQSSNGMMGIACGQDELKTFLGGEKD